VLYRPLFCAIGSPHYPTAIAGIASTIILALGLFLCINNPLTLLSSVATHFRRLLAAALLPVALSGAALLTSCDKDEPTPPADGPYLVFKLKVDPNQARLNNLGQPASIPAGHGAQTPSFKKVGVHYIELTPTMYTQVGQGQKIYQSAETSLGGSNAIDFDQLNSVADGEVIYKVPIKNLTPGTFQYLRVSIAYQEYDVAYTASSGGQSFDFTGRIASFVGYNQYLRKVAVSSGELSVNANRKQGFWVFYTQTPFITRLDSGSAPSTTVPNPIASTSPIPAGSCLVTGGFAQPFTITGNETKDVVVVVSLSVNNSFEWLDPNGNNKWEPLLGETVVDMGLRGLIPSVE